jgi:hypothetical protein
MQKYQIAFFSLAIFGIIGIYLFSYFGLDTWLVLPGKTIYQNITYTANIPSDLTLNALTANYITTNTINATNYEGLPLLSISTVFGNAGFELNEGTSGYDAVDKELLYQLQTGEDMNGHIYRQITHQFIPMNANVVIDSAFSSEFLYPVEEGAYWQMYVVFGDINYGVSPQTYYDDSQVWKYVGFYYVNDGNYTVKLLAITEDATGSEITQIDNCTYGSPFNLLRIEYSETSVKFYYNNILEATHTTHIPWDNTPSTSRIGVSSQSEFYDEGALFYFWGLKEYQ